MVVRRKWLKAVLGSVLCAAVACSSGAGGTSETPAGAESGGAGTGIGGSGGGGGSAGALSGGSAGAPVGSSTGGGGGEGLAGAPTQAALFATSDAARSTGVAPDADVARVVAGSNTFAVDLYRELRADGTNVWFSPWSLTQGLAMAWAGAVDPAATEIATVFGFWDDPLAVHGAINSLDRTLSYDDDRLTLKTANRLWIKPDRTPLAPFLDTLAIYYGAGVGVVDLSDTPTALALINGWVEQETAGAIPTLLEPGDLPLRTSAVLTDALYLKTLWDEPFDLSETTPEPFTLADGSQVSVPMMSHVFTQTRYAEDTAYQAVALPYATQGSGFSLQMVFVLPKTDFAALDASIDADGLAPILDALSAEPVELHAPKLTLRVPERLRDALSALGMPTPFVDDGAFVNLCEPPPGHVNNVVHQATLEMDERGTTASAATAVVFVDGGVTLFPVPPPVVRLDRPFLLAVRDRTTGLVLFMGRVEDPTEGGL